MNHYERLKVSPDAPIEVIRAAYRALAAKHHPDRHTQSQSSHSDMAALNAAYEILADVAARAAYDAELAAEAATQPPDARDPVSRVRNLWRSTMGLGGDPTTMPGQHPEEADESRVDVHWQMPPSPTPDNPWLKRRRLLPLAGVLGTVALLAGGWWMRDMIFQMQAEQALSRHYGDKVEGHGGVGRRPMVTMTDEELLANPPGMPGSPMASAQAPRENHALDGAPLALRAETNLVDPLAQPSTGASPTPADQP